MLTHTFLKIRHFTFITGTILSAAILPTLSQAATLFTNFGPGETTTSPSAWRAVGEIPDVGNTRIAMPFTASQTGSLDSVRLLISKMPESTSNVLEVHVYDQTIAEEPGVSLDAMIVDNAPIFPQAEIRTATSTLHPVLSAGNKYWLVLTSEGFFGWVQTGTAGIAYKYSTDAGASWKQSGITPSFHRQSAFSILGTPIVPEPTSLLLLCWITAATLTRRQR